MRTLFAVAAVLAFASAAPAVAQTDGAPVQTLAPIVVTAARLSQPLAGALPQTTSFDRDEIAESGAVDLSDLLSLAPGAQVSRNGGPGAVSSVFLRGAASNQSLVLIDGVRVESASLGTTQLSQVLLNGVDHVEVVNGNVSALYGSNAVGGVIQVFTDDGGNHPPRFHAQAGYGSYHTQTQSAGANGALDADGRTTFSIDATRYKTDGFSALDPARAPGANPDANGFLATTVSGQVKHRFTADWAAGLRFYDSTGTLSFDDSFGLPTDINVQRSRVRMLSAFADGAIGDRWTTHLIVAQSDDDSTDYLNDTANGRFNSRNRQLTWQNEFALAAHHKLVFGYEGLTQTLDSDAYQPPERRVNSGFAGYQGNLGANEFQFNVRRDQFSDFGGANSYYAGYGYAFTNHWKAILSLSDAFRAPTFNDLYFPDFGNPAIQPERSHTLEAALQYSFGAGGVARLTAFQTRYHNLIDAQQVEPGVFRAENVGRARVQGLEGSVQGRLAGTTVKASVTLQDPRDQDTGQDLARRARQLASLAVAHRFGDWRVGGEWLVSGPRGDSGARLGGYGVVNLSARYDLAKSWFITARIDNLLNKDYALAYAYNTPRRGAYVTLGWNP